jgi:hypothetical protein
MKGFVLGLLVAALGFGGYLYWNSSLWPGQPALDRGQETRLAATPDAAALPNARRKRGRGAARVARARASAAGVADKQAPVDPEPEPIRLTEADLKVIGQGDNLSRPDVLRLDMTTDESLPELSQDEIDARFRAQEAGILDCIADARPDPETYVPGRVTVKFRIQRAGTVRGVRVEAPAILHKGGLYGCVRGVVMRLRFPPSGSSQVIAYPFTLS